MPNLQSRIQTDLDELQSGLASRLQEIRGGLMLLVSASSPGADGSQVSTGGMSLALSKLQGLLALWTETVAVMGVIDSLSKALSEAENSDIPEIDHLKSTLDQLESLIAEISEEDVMSSQIDKAIRALEDIRDTGPDLREIEQLFDEAQTCLDKFGKDS